MNRMTPEKLAQIKLAHKYVVSFVNNPDGIHPDGSEQAYKDLLGMNITGMLLEEVDAQAAEIKVWKSKWNGTPPEWDKSS
jgi:hypothetical protein